MIFHKTVTEIKNLLEKTNCWYDYMEHEPVRTSEEAAAIRPKYSIDQGAKALIVRVKKSNTEKYFCMLVLAGNRKFDQNKVKILLNAKDIRFATEEEVEKITDGIKPGGVPPFGNLFNIDVFADISVFEQEKIVFNAGDKRVSIAMFARDYKRLVNPTITTLT